MPRREQLEEMLASEPDDVFLMYALAMLDVSDGEADAALERLDRVLKRDSDYVAAYFQCGQILAQLGRTVEARDALSNGIQVANKVGDSHAAAEMTEFLHALD